MKVDPQRYRLTYEYDLKDRADYQFVRSLLLQAIKSVENKLSSDMLADRALIEKVDR